MGDRGVLNRRQPLPAHHGSLAFGVQPSVPGTLHVLAAGGGVACPPKEGRQLKFGRNAPEVDVCVGADDRKVSRHHGTLTFRSGSWWLTNHGRMPLQLPNSRKLFASEEPVPLSEGYTPAFVTGSGPRRHLLELFVTGHDRAQPTPKFADPTQPPRIWRLSDDERIALVVLGQRYLMHERYPQPLTWKQTAELLAELRPDGEWVPRKVERVVTAVRERLSRGGVPGLTREEIGEPVGNSLNDNLIKELMLTTTLVPPDLAVLDDLD